MLIISGVEKGSIGKELKLKNDDKVISFNGFDAKNELDYIYYNSQNKFILEIETKNGKKKFFDIEKDEEESLGLDFISQDDHIKTCQNNCIFCFIDQMPKGLRDTLYVKDDDYQMSFMCGNFVTLTNLKDEDIDRIIRLKLSPMYISVHAIDGEVRRKIMNNRFADKIEKHIKKLTENNIEIHTQVVLVKDLNDGDVLINTAKKLFNFYPMVKTMAVVPCGVTRFREGLYKAPLMNDEYSKNLIGAIDKLNKEFNANFILPADEFFFKAKMPVKPYEFYGDFSQIENGIGMTAKFKKELFDAIEIYAFNKQTLNNADFNKQTLNNVDFNKQTLNNVDLNQALCNKKKFNKQTKKLIVTGYSAFEFIKEMANKVEQNTINLKIDAARCLNNFFGETINCTGLLVGVDILNCLKAQTENYDEIIIPSCTLKEFEEVFLDGMTLADLKNNINTKITISKTDGESFYNCLVREV